MRSKNQWSMVVLSLLVLLALLIAGCSDDDDNPSTPPAQQTGVVTGTVMSAAKAPLANVLVTVGGKTGTSNEQGFFTVADVPVGDHVASLARAGYMTTYRNVTVEGGQTTYLTNVVLPDANQGTVDGATGGSVNSGPGAVQFAPNSFVDADGNPYTGTATVTVAARNPESSDFFDAFPGDFTGVRTDGSTVQFASYGFMDVVLSSPGKTGDLRLADGAAATLTMNIPAGKLDAAPDTIPMWYFDPDDGRWHEDGRAVRQGSAYVAEVTHFTTWNWDVPVSDICSITGVVHDAEGSPVPGVTVYSESRPLGLRDSDVTGSDGAFTVRALKNSTTTVWAVSGTNRFGPMMVAVDDTCPVVLPDPILVTPPAYSITLTWGEEPSDLDSHLWIPMTWNENYNYYHIAYYNDGTMTEDPYAFLDTDDTSSFGPEIISGARLYQGTYHYWVNNYSNDDSAELHDTSQAVVRVEAGSQSAIFRAADVPMQGADPSGWWHVFDMTVSAGGSVTITPVQRFEAYPEDYSPSYGDDKRGAAKK